MGIGFFLATLILGAVAAAYLQEFHAQFDHFILGAFFDDQIAVLETAMTIHRPSLVLVLGLLVAFSGSRLTVWSIQRPVIKSIPSSPLFSTRPRQLVLGLVLLVAIVGSVRGSLLRRPVQEKDAAVISDPLLAELVLNPFEALRYATNHYLRLAGSDGLAVYLPDRAIAAAAAEFSGRHVHDLDEATLRIAHGRGEAGRPRHVFLVVMESYDAWPLLEEYAPLGLVDGLRSLASEGLLMRNFLPASTGTMTSLAAIMTGMADAGIMTNYQPSARAPYPSSLASIFQRLGYRTELFYSGFLSWQRIGAFAKAQGFDRVHGGAEMGGWLEINEWGVDDEDLFDFVARTVSDDVPTFSLILSATNHPPYDVDVYEKGFPIDTIPPAFASGLEAGNAGLLQLGHLWYSDREVTRWLRATSQRFPSALFAVTGDHWSRRFIGAHPNLYARSAVPLLLYGPAFRNRVRPDDAVGTHLDIGPTLIERVAERGFVYHSMGHDLLGPERPAIATARHAMMGTGLIFDPARSGPPEALAGRSGEKPEIDDAQWRHLHSIVHGIAWWRIMRGPDLPSSDDRTSASASPSEVP